MDKNDQWFLITVIITLGLLSFGAGRMITQDKYMDQAIERGYAEYDLKTGEWGWK